VSPWLQLLELLRAQELAALGGRWREAAALGQQAQALASSLPAPSLRERPWLEEARSRLAATEARAQAARAALGGELSLLAQRRRALLAYLPAQPR
jgi:hypothetical protein